MRESAIILTALALAVSCKVQTAEECISPCFGHWEEGGNGFPVYNYTGNLPFEVPGVDTDLPEDPYFLLGNHRIALVTHISGIYQMITAERAWARANASVERPDYGQVEGCVVVNGDSLRLFGIGALSSDASSCTRRFGVGFADYEYRTEAGVVCTRTLSVRPSASLGEGEAGFVVDVTLSNNGTGAAEVSYRETLPLNYVPMGIQMKEDAEGRGVGYVYDISRKGNALCAEINAKPTRLMIVPGKRQHSPLDFYPESVFIKSDNAGLDCSGNGLSVNESFTLAAGESKTLTFALGFGDAGKVSLNEGVAGREGRYLAEWDSVLPDFDDEQDSVLRRELVWNAHFVEASAKHSSYYNETFIPQGTVYSYHYGDNIAARDHLQAMLPACYTNPALAKSSIRYVLEHTDYDGEIKRGNTGFGYSEPTIYQESDPQLYVFNSVGEYLRVTGDYDFLDEEILLYPAEAGVTETVYNVLVRNFSYLRDVIRTGSHGFVRLMNSDWSDSFLHRYSPNATLWHAESHLNTAMVLAVLPEFITQMKAAGRDGLAEAVSNYRDGLLKAYLDDLGDRKFSARAHFEHGCIGEDIVCIEPHSYIFSIPELSIDRKKEIYGYIYPRISDVTGLRTREKSLWGGKPEGEDGGIWFSLEYPLLLGVSTFDKDEAWRLLKMFSFSNYTEHYPQYWMGQWTAPDELDSSLSHAGLYNFWTGMPDCSICFQGFCSHPHTWPLYCYFKLKENLN